MGDSSYGIDPGRKADQFLRHLRHDTAPQHGMLESSPLLAALMQPGVTIQDYYGYLVLMQGIARFYEEYMLPELYFLFPASRQRLSSVILGEDLDHISRYPGLTFRPAPFTMGDMNITVASALGFMYVTEGSKLGGKIIYKHIHKQLGFTSGNGAAYIADKGSDTSLSWKNFIHLFSCYVVENGLEQEVIQYAGCTFSSIKNYFDLNRNFHEA